MYDRSSAKLLNGELEQLVYWPFDDLRPASEYRRTIDKIAENSPFTAVVCAQRSHEHEVPMQSDQVNALKDAVTYAHSRGLRFGVEVVANSAADGARPIKLADMQGIAVHTASPLAAADLQQGRKQVFVSVAQEVPVKGTRTARVQDIRLLRAYLYKQVDWCHFEPNSLVDITDQASLTPTQSREAVVSIQIDPDKLDCGYVVHVITVHYYDFPNLWSDLASEAVESRLQAYAPASPDGAILRSDNICLGMLHMPRLINAETQESTELRTCSPKQWYCAAMSDRYKQTTERSLEEDLLYMTVAPTDNDGRRSRALTDYFDLHRSRVVELERAMYEAVKNAFGESAFVATCCNPQESSPEEIWRNGLSRWDEKSDFGHASVGSDPAVGLALGRKWGSRVWYDSYCRHLDVDLNEMSRHAVDIARVGGRVHYRALNDSDACSDHNISEGLNGVSKIENNIKLLNWFQAELPESDIVVVMGYPEMVTADKPGTESGVNSRYAAGFETARMLRSMGYSCDVVPSYEIDDNDLRICCSGGAHYGLTGSYRLLVYVLPEYSKPATLDFLDRYLNAGGKLVLVGDCTQDVDGNDVSDRFAKLRYSSVAAFGQTVFADSDRVLLERTLSQLDIKPNDITNGSRFSNREVVLVQDYAEILRDAAVSTEFTVDGHTVSAEFSGVFAVKLCKSGGLERLAASKLSCLKLDGTDIFRFDTPRDVLAHRPAHRAPHIEDEFLVVYPSESMVPNTMACPRPGRE